jgi:hypothetical protein
MAVYALLYGLPEAIGLSGLPLLGSKWQVPSDWVGPHAPWRMMIVWGSVLGPCFLTINPYAGFWLLVPAVAYLGGASKGVVFAVAIGAAHGLGRSLSVVRDSRELARSTAKSDDELVLEYKRIIARSALWRIADGYLLVIVGGVAVLNCLYYFS